jgi:hypothetical protein
MVKIKKENETKRERFVRLAESRTKAILNSLRILGNCSSSKYYEYNKEDVVQIFAEIEKKTKDIKNLFYSELYKFKAKSESFSLKHRS